MRGPGLRLDLDVRRRWRCPLCGVERRTEGDVTQIRCGCTSDGVLMQLSPVPRAPRPQPKPHDPYMDVDSFGDELEERVDETAVVLAPPSDAEPAAASPSTSADRPESPRGDRRGDRKSRRPDRRPREQPVSAPVAAMPSETPAADTSAETSGGGPDAAPHPAPDVSPPPDPGT